MSRAPFIYGAEYGKKIREAVRLETLSQHRDSHWNEYSGSFGYFIFKNCVLPNSISLEAITTANLVE
eukprot:scaffold1192_cov58-Cylindrotheca_fusiformis.AAC.16